MNINEANDNYFEDVITITPSIPLLEEISSHLKAHGFYCLEKSLDLKALAAFQKEVDSLISTKGKRYFSLINPYKNIESKFALLDKSCNLKKFIIELAKSGANKDVSNSEILNVLRIVTGKNADGQSLKFHYDATVITALVPILIPNGSIECCGHLLAHKNLRNIRKSALVNFMEKIIVQNPISQKIISFLVLRKIENYVCELKEGNIYFFYGYRTLHANLPVNPDFVRATLLFHFGNPHNDSFLIKSVAKFRHWRENLNFK
jgi:hypothetical protein